VRNQRQFAAFTLLELLVVIAIIGILVAIALPNLGNFKLNTMAAGTRQMLDDLARARQLAISQRTTVFMVFVPPGFWTRPGFVPALQQPAFKLLDKQYVGYTFVSLRSLGDQPGQRTSRAYNTWRTLPDGIIIHPDKFGTTPPRDPVMWVTNRMANPALNEVYAISPFHYTNSIPFPLDTNIYLPYIAFNHQGQLVDAAENLVPEDELIPLGLGSVNIPRDPNTKLPLTTVLPTVTETPVGNSTNQFNLVRIDKITGRARIVRQEILP
jgi:prepilin-type N-terminal cleavage/methylation domain-containing protein